jgi:hypothetical protein
VGPTSDDLLVGFFFLFFFFFNFHRFSYCIFMLSVVASLKVSCSSMLKKILKIEKIKKIKIRKAYVKMQD